LPQFDPIEFLVVFEEVRLRIDLKEWRGLNSDLGPGERGVVGLDEDVVMVVAEEAVEVSEGDRHSSVSASIAGVDRAPRLRECRSVVQGALLSEGERFCSRDLRRTDIGDGGWGTDDGAVLDRPRPYVGRR